MKTVLTERLGCRVPVVQTAMGWIATAKLVAATSNAGGFGFLAAATMSTAELEQALAELRAATRAPFGVNFHMFQPNAKDVIALILANRDRVRAVSYGRGPDAATIAAFRQAGVLCMPTVGALKHAVKAIELGADVITVQGAEGGGHTGAVPTTILLPQVLNVATVPVVAAGGFCDGRGLAAALAYGAAGVAMGTRFLLTAESPVPRATLERYLQCTDPAAIRTTTAVDGLPHRMIDTDLVLRLESGGPLRQLWTAVASAWKWKARTGMSLGQMLRTALLALEDRDSMAQALMSANAPVLIQRAMVEGRPDEGVLPSGQVAAAISDLPTVAELIERIVREAEERLALAAAPPPAAKDPSRPRPLLHGVGSP